MTALTAMLCILLMQWGFARQLDMMYLGYVSRWLNATDKDVVLVAVDERTAQALNGWPLKAEHYAALIDHLTAYEVGAVTLMLPSASLDGTSSGHPLADSIGKNGKVLTIVLPSRAWAKPEENPDPRTRRAVCESAKIIQPRPADGVCDDRLAAAAPAYSVVSALDVMGGKISRQKMKGRLVVVGSTLTSHRRWKPESGTGTSTGYITRAQLLAHDIGALANHGLPRIAGPWLQILFIAVVSAALCVILLATGPTASLMATALLASSAALCTFVVLKVGHRFLFPSPVVLACLVTYTTWTWWRQRALLRDVSHASRTSKWINSVPEATLVVAPGGTVVLANEAATGSALPAQGGDANKTLVGLPVSQVLFAITASHKAMEFARQAVNRLSGFRPGPATRAPDGSLTEGVELVDGNARQLLIKYVAVPDFFGCEYALVFYIADITYVRKVERQRDVMFRFMSHDLRSRQAAILALVEQMRLSPPGMANDEFRERVAQCGTAALTMVDDFLFLARAESQVARLAPVDLALLLGDAVDDQWSQAKAKEISVVLDAEPGRLVFGDAQLLRRAFENVLSNAVKFSFRRGTVRVELAEHRDMWQVNIIDNGVGMAADRAQEIYREFVRLEDDERQGYGLGLAFVKRVMDTSGGQISIASVEGLGTTIILRLPKFLEPSSTGATLL